jgi:hypothetical protein
MAQLPCDGTPLVAGPGRVPRTRSRLSVHPDRPRRPRLLDRAVDLRFRARSVVQLAGRGRGVADAQVCGSEATAGPAALLISMGLGPAGRLRGAQRVARVRGLAALGAGRGPSWRDCRPGEPGTASGMSRPARRPRGGETVAAGHVREVAVRRHAIGSEQRFASVVGGIFGGVSRLDTGALVSGLAARDSCEQVSFVVQQAQGSAGLLRFLQPGLDPVLALDPQAPDRAGRRMVGLIAGNPLTMGQLTRHVADASSSAPVTILIQELPAAEPGSVTTRSPARSPLTTTRPPPRPPRGWTPGYSRCCVRSAQCQSQQPAEPRRCRPPPAPRLPEQPAQALSDLSQRAGLPACRETPRRDWPLPEPQPAWA